MFAILSISIEARELLVNNTEFEGSAEFFRADSARLGEEETALATFKVKIDEYGSASQLI